MKASEVKQLAKSLRLEYIGKFPEFYTHKLLHAVRLKWKDNEHIGFEELYASSSDLKTFWEKLDSEKEKSKTKFYAKCKEIREELSKHYDVIDPVLLEDYNYEWNFGTRTFLLKGLPRSGDVA